MDALPANPTSESRDGQGAGDHDIAFAFGSPASNLTTIVQARCLIMRGYVRDYLHGERGGAADGDLSYTEDSAAGLHVPVSPAFDPMPDTPLPEDLYLG